MKAFDNTLVNFFLSPAHAPAIFNFPKNADLEPYVAFKKNLFDLVSSKLLAYTSTAIIGQTAAATMPCHNQYQMGFTTTATKRCS